MKQDKAGFAPDAGVPLRMPHVTNVRWAFRSNLTVYDNPQATPSVACTMGQGVTVVYAMRERKCRVDNEGEEARAPCVSFTDVQTCWILVQKPFSFGVALSTHTAVAASEAAFDCPVVRHSLTVASPPEPFVYPVPDEGGNRMLVVAPLLLSLGPCFSTTGTHVLSMLCLLHCDVM